MIEGMPTEPSQPRAQILRRPRLERDEQRVFANWCLLNGLPFCWHATHKRSTATTGVFDFWVGNYSRSGWIEFKRKGGKLSPEQRLFADRLTAQDLHNWHIVETAAQAIAIVKGWRV
jgi:hypothetical protein